MRLKLRRLMVAVVVIFVMVVGVGMMALANHPATTDAGVDVAWTNDMNQESYWESLWGTDCTKFPDHSGLIGAQYDAVVIKSGSTYVRVYADLTNTGEFMALGPPNPNDQHPNRRFEAPFSWVMKCTLDQTTTTTTTIIEEPTTTTTVPGETTTTVAETTTTVAETTTTTDPGTTTTTPPSGGTLPFTGIENAPGLWVSGLLAILAGAGLLWRSRIE